MKRYFLIPALGLAASAAASAQIYYGTDDVSQQDNFVLDIATGVSTGPVFTGSDTWGLADDDANQVMYVNDGTTLRSWQYGSAAPATTLGLMTYNGANRSLVSLAHNNGVLYGNPNIAVEGLYTIDVVTLATTLVHTFSATTIDLGGLDFDPATGLLYGSNDSATYAAPQGGPAGRGVIVFDLSGPTVTETNMYPYPVSATGAAITDIDGLAFDPAGVVYMLEDNPAPLHRFVIATNGYDPNPPQNAVLGSEVFSGGTHTTLNGGGGVGTNYCTANANSTGVAARISATGSASVAANNLVLAADAMPLNATGFFLTSLTQGLIANPGGSQGNLCLAGSIGRYVGPGQIKNSGATGSISLAINLTQHPQPSGAVSVQVGETWNFTAWFRDSVGGSATSNFTDGLSVTFN